MVKSPNIRYERYGVLRGFDHARILRTNNETVDCFAQYDNAELIQPDHCRGKLLVLPVLMGSFTMFLIFYYWKKSRKTCCKVSCWCYPLQRRKLHTEDSNTEVASGEDQAKQERQRSIVQRELPLQASIRRQRRENHQLQLENAGRLEKLHKKSMEEANVLKDLLLIKFNESNLEHILTEDDFTTVIIEACESKPPCLNTYEGEIMNQADANHNGDFVAANPHEQVDSNGDRKLWKHQEQNQRHVSGLTLKREFSTYLRTSQTSDIAIPIGTNRNASVISSRCAICLQDYQPHERIIFSDNPSCSHCYHRDCIIDYLIPRLKEKSSGHPILRRSPSVSRTESTNNEHLFLQDQCPPCPCCRLPFFLEIPNTVDASSASLTNIGFPKTENESDTR